MVEGAAGSGRGIRVLVVDDQAIVRDGLATVLSLLPDVEVVGEAGDGAEAVRLVAELAPDVVLMDLRMPVLDGTAATEAIVAAHPATAVLVLTTFADDASISGALGVGARGYLTKDASRGEVAAAIRAVASGQSTFSPEVGARLIGTFTATPHPEARPAPPPPPQPEALPLASRFPQLTARELDVFELIAQGLSNPEIAGRLFVSTATVKTHINSLFAKLHVRSRREALAQARGDI